MRISAIVTDALRVAVKARRLWLFGFFVGLGSAGGGGTGGFNPVSGEPRDLSLLLLIALVIVVIAVAVFVMRFLSEGALIEGVKRHWHDETLTVRQGFRDGAAHVGVVFLIKVVYVVASTLSFLLLVLPFVFAMRVAGLNALTLALAVVAVLVAVPWLITLNIWQAFALRIAVLENRRAVDAIKKARLFLHGRLLHGLKLMIATLLGTLVLALLTVVVTGPLVLLTVSLALNFGLLPIIVLAPVVLVVLFLCVAVAGTYQSSVWTLGYLGQAEA
jgi:hypothetical protein